jgi:hypothetical protein
MRKKFQMVLRSTMNSRRARQENAETPEWEPGANERFQASYEFLHSFIDRIYSRIQKFLMSLLIYGKLLDQPNVAPREDRGHAFVSTDRKERNRSSRKDRNPYPRLTPPLL